MLTVAETARILGVHRTTVNHRLETGGMRGERVHRNLWVVPRSEVERWQALGRQRPGRPRKRQTEA